MSGQQITDPELNSVHSVKILLCYILDRLNRSVTEEQLMAVSRDSGIINYFCFSDALEELIANGSVVTEPYEDRQGNATRTVAVTEKGRLGSEYFNRYIPLVFRRKILKAAFAYFAALDRESLCSCTVDESDNGCTVHFRLMDGSCELINMSFYAPDRDQAEMISDRIRSNPTDAYRNILGYLLNNPDEQINIEKYL